MGDIEGLSDRKLKELILRQLKELGVDLDVIKIKVEKGPRVSLRGEVYSDRERHMVLQTVIDTVGADAISDGLVVVHGLYDDIEEDGGYRGDGLTDQDEDFIGTEDVFQSIEDGIPYIPPTSPAYQKTTEKEEWKKRKKKMR
ncbi:MAG: BON domain-containing protein [Candidatus Omnitrophota bacterium]